MTIAPLSRAARLRERLALTHVEHRAHQRLRERWQRRLDAGEDVYCPECRRHGVSTRIDPRNWAIRPDVRAPECARCHRISRTVR